MQFVDEFQGAAGLMKRKNASLKNSCKFDNHFFQESPLTLLTSFLYRCIRHRNFDPETVRLLSSFLQHCQRKYSVDASSLTWQLSKEVLQRIAVALVKIAISQSFDSAFHQREFLRCLASAQFEKSCNGKFLFYVCIVCIVNKI